jgi:hypothetical protein
MPATNAELIRFLGLEGESSAVAMVERLCPEARAAYERMMDVQGLLDQGIRPDGVLLDYPRKRRCRRR